MLLPRSSPCSSAFPRHSARSVVVVDRAERREIFKYSNTPVSLRRLHIYACHEDAAVATQKSPAGNASRSRLPAHIAACAARSARYTCARPRHIRQNTRDIGRVIAVFATPPASPFSTAAMRLVVAYEIETDIDASSNMVRADSRRFHHAASPTYTPSLPLHGILQYTYITGRRSPMVLPVIFLLIY